jgi:hypothetical protein
MTAPVITIRHVLIGVSMFFLVGAPVGLWFFIPLVPFLWWSIKELPSAKWKLVDWDRLELEMIL